MLPQMISPVRVAMIRGSFCSGTTLVKAGADFAEERVRFLIRYTAREITTKMYVRYRGSRYDIEYVNDYGDGHEFMELWCRWRGKEGRP